MEIKKYQGNEFYMSFLLKEDKQLYVFYAKVKDILFTAPATDKAHRGWPVPTSIIPNGSEILELTFNPINGCVWHALTIDDEKDFDLVNRVLEGVLNDRPNK